MPRYERRLIELSEHEAGHERTAFTAPEIVHNYRILRNFTQEIAAADYGVSTRTWQRYEAGTVRVPTPLLKRISAWARRVCPEMAGYVSS